MTFVRSRDIKTRGLIAVLQQFQLIVTATRLTATFSRSVFHPLKGNDKRTTTPTFVYTVSFLFDGDYLRVFLDVKIESG